MTHELAYLEHGDTLRVHCAADTTQHSLLLSPDVTALEVTALTSYGRSPPATLYLNHTDTHAHTHRYTQMR